MSYYGSPPPQQQANPYGQNQPHVQQPPMQYPMQQQPTQYPMQQPIQQQPMQYPMQQPVQQQPMGQQPAHYSPQQQAPHQSTFSSPQHASPQPQQHHPHQQPQHQQHQQHPVTAAPPGKVALAPESFKTGLCGCFDDCGICIFGYFCPACLYGENAARLNGDGCCTHCLLYYFCQCFVCIFGGTTRHKVRTRYNLHEEPCSDCCVHCWCSPCAVCQEARELKTRG